MSFLEQYDAINANQPLLKMGPFSNVVRTPKVGAMFAERREHRPIFVMPAATLVTRFSDAQEVLRGPKILSVRLYRDRMDRSVGPFVLARD